MAGLLNRTLVRRLSRTPLPIELSVESTVLGVVAVAVPPSFDDLVAHGCQTPSVVRCSLVLHYLNLSPTRSHLDRPTAAPLAPLALAGAAEASSPVSFAALISSW